LSTRQRTEQISDPRVADIVAAYGRRVRRVRLYAGLFWIAVGSLILLATFGPAVPKPGLEWIARGTPSLMILAGVSRCLWRG
jgi:hypothetical protein